MVGLAEKSVYCNKCIAEIPFFSPLESNLPSNCFISVEIATSNWKIFVMGFSVLQKALVVITITEDHLVSNCLTTTQKEKRKH